MTAVEGLDVKKLSKLCLFSVVVAALPTLLALPVMAADAPDLAERQRMLIEQSVEARRGAVGGLLATVPVEPTGEDLMILRERDLFYGKFTTRLSASDNIALSPVDREDSAVLEAALAFGVETTIDRTYDVFAEVSVGTRVTEDDDFAYDYIGGAIGGVVPLGAGIELLMGYFPTQTYEHFFEEDALTIHTLVISPSKTWQLDGKTELQAHASLVGTTASKGDYDSYGLELGARLRKVVAEAYLLSFSLSATGTRYPSFYQQLFGEDREDVTLSAALKLERPLSRNISAFADITARQNYSSIDPVDYEVYTAGVGLTVDF